VKSGSPGASDAQAANLLPIGNVVALLNESFPDVTHSSLRFLEREGLVVPLRTPGGHRLYRPEDLDRLRQIKTWQAERHSLGEIRQRLSGQSELGSPKAVADRFLAEALAGELVEAAAVIRSADDLGMPMKQIFEDVLRPALYEVGERWQAGTLRVGQEKEISELARDLIAELSRRHADPAPHGPAVVAACVSGERHDLGLRMVAGLLRARGWRVHFLGSDVDPRFLSEVVQLRKPDVVLLSATTRERLPDIEHAIAAVHENDGDANTPIVVGGGVVALDTAADLRSCGAVVAIDDSIGAAEEAVNAQRRP
jgi:MerR family transcriptional regulator, light-induced transcriptional regulator